MATYQVTMPNGKVISQDLPDGMSDQMVKAAFLKHYKANGFSTTGAIVDQAPQTPQAQQQPDPPPISPATATNPLLAGSNYNFDPPTIENKIASYLTPTFGDTAGNYLAHLVASNGPSIPGFQQSGQASQYLQDKMTPYLGQRGANTATDALNNLTPVGNVTGAGDALGQLRDAFTGPMSWGKAGEGLGGIAGLLGSLMPVAHGVVTSGAMAGMAGHLLQDENGVIRAWHGSPHDFDQFDMSKIGTGEGAQAYGHGLYFAENPDVAKSYQTTLANMRPDHVRASLIDKGISEDLADVYARYAGDTKGARGSFQNFADSINQPAPHDWQETYRNTLRPQLPDLQKAIQASQGHLYEVNINAHPDHFLDWDAPLSEQHPTVQQAFQDNFDRQQALKDYEHHGPDKAQRIVDALWSDPSGANMYRNMPTTGVDLMQHAPEDRAALMSSLGIPGIKYLDQGSRGAGNGTHNYVVFDPKLISILAKH